jgi:hypothetical protein
MVAGNANYTSDLLSSTFEIFMKDQPSDTIFGDLVLWDVLSKKGKVTKRGGSMVLEPLMYSKSSAVGSYSGYDVLDISPQQGLTNAQFNWKQYYGTVAISSEEELKNRGPMALLDILKARFAQAKMSLADKMNSDMFLDGTGNNSKDVDGLAIAIDSAGTYGNIVRSANSWWGAQETAVSGVLAIQGSTGMRRMFNDCSLGRGRVTPDFMLTTQAVFEAYEALMDPNMRFTNSGTKDVGFANQNLMFRDKPLFWDDYCQSGLMYFANTEFLRIVIQEGRDGGVSKGDDRDNGDFRVEPFEKPINQDAKIAKFFWMGNLVSGNCRHQGKLTGLTN